VNKMTESKTLMGTLFLSFFIVFIIGDIAKNTAEFNCPGFIKRSEEMIGSDIYSPDTTKSESGVIEEQERITEETEKEIEDASELTDEEWDELVEEELDARQRWLREHGWNFIADTREWFGQFEPIKWLNQKIAGVAVKIKQTMENFVIKIPFQKELGTLYIGMRALTSNCSGMQGIGFIILTPIVLGNLYIILRLIRGGG